MKKCLLIFIALSVLVTSCSSKHVIPTEQVLQDPEKYKIASVTTVDGEVIDFPYTATIRDNKIVGYSKNDSLEVIPLSEIQSMSHMKADRGKNIRLVIGCVGALACVFVLFAFRAAVAEGME